MRADVIDRILDFNVLVSDKAAYRSPTRGLQGNAWKTVLGIPAATGITSPVFVEALGARHELAVSIDPGGNVAIRHHQGPLARTPGTAVTVPLPASLHLDLPRWAAAFACFNPHATVIHPAESGGPDSLDSYKPTAADGWRLQGKAMLTSSPKGGKANRSAMASAACPAAGRYARHRATVRWRGGGGSPSGESA